MQRSEVIENFLNSDYAKNELETLKKEAALKDKKAADNQLGIGPTQDEISIAHPSGGTTTQQVTGGDQYNLSSTAIPGGDGAKVETITEVHTQMENVARKEKTSDNGQPFAHDASLKGLSKNAVETKEDKQIKAKDEKKDTTKEAKVKLLNDLVKIADKLEEKGLIEEAAEIDAIIKAEAGVKEKEEIKK